MYERMISALELNQSFSELSPKKGRNDFNQTNMSFGKEIEQIHRQFQEEMVGRVEELEL